MEQPSPDAQPSIDRLLSEVGDMVETIRTHKGPLHITPEIFEQIEQLEVALAWFKDTNQFLYNQSDIDIEKLKAESIAKSDHLSNKEKQFFKQAQAIEKDAKTLQLAYSKALERGKGKKHSDKETSALKQRKKERRKLFKPLGGDKKWIPL